MARRRITARKSNSNRLNSPYRIRMRYGEDVHSYITRLTAAIHSFHLNELHGVSDYDTPARQVHILLSTLPARGPLGEIKRKYSNVMIDGRPNRERYEYRGRWILTIGYIETVMMDALQRHEYNQNQYNDSDEEVESSYTPLTPQNSSGEEEPIEDEDPEEEQT